MATISLNVPAGIANAVLSAAAAELGLSTSATQAEQITAVKGYLKGQLAGLVRKQLIDKGRRDGEASATATLPDFDQIS